MSSGLTGARVVVIGASSGIGRGVAINARKAGADVIAAARRKDRLEALVADAPGLQTLQLDIRDDASRTAFTASVRERFEQVDVLFFSAGAAPLESFAQTTERHWSQAIETNVIGVNRTIAGLIDALSDRSVTMVVSSEAVHAPRSHLGAYGASKAALEHSIEQWREEHPWNRYTVISLGATIPTEFGDAFDPDTLMEAMTSWGASGRQQSTFMATDEVCAVLADTIGSLLAAPTVDMRSIVLRTPSPPETDAETFVQTAREGGQDGPISRA